MTLSWILWSGRLSPVFEATDRADDALSCLGSFLMDDGGCGLDHSVAFLRECCDELNGVELERAGVWERGREDWGARLVGDRIQIYSLYDEEHVREIGVHLFARLLFEWISFLQAGPVENKVLVEVIARDG